jgi:hypothetical protein
MRSSADMTLVRADRISARLWFRRGYLRAPEWIGVQLDQSRRSLASALKSKSVREDRRRIRKYGLVYAISHKRRDFDDFYENMYVPYIRKRFGEMGGISSARYLRHAFRQGGLIFVEQNGARLAGTLFSRYGKAITFEKMGTRNGEDAILKMGAMAALYVFGIEYARKTGCRFVDFGGCRPLLQDGVLRYKSKWGARVIDDGSYPIQYLISWNRLGGPVGDFFGRNALIFYEGNGFSAICARSPRIEAAEYPLRIRPPVNGLRHLYVAAGGPETPLAYPNTGIKKIGHASTPGRFEVLQEEGPYCS